MAFLNLIAAVKTIARVGEGGNLNLRGTRDGLAFTTNELMAYALEGRVINAAVGSASTVVTFTASYAVGTPELNIDVPSGTAIFPLQMSVYLEAQAGALTEVLASVQANLTANGTSTAVTPASTRTDAPYSSLCTVRSHYTGAGTTATAPVEFWHHGWNFADAAANTTHFIQWKYTDGAPTVVVGPGSLSLWVNANGNTAPTGFIRATWIEIPSSSIT